MVPLVSIVIVNHNGKHHLIDCLSSIEKMKYKNKEIVLIDNGSTDESISFLSRIKWIKKVFNEKNLGLAKARNQGIENSKGKYIAFLDNDTEVDKNWLIQSVKLMESDQEIAGCTSKVLVHADKKLINSAGIECDIYGFAFNRGFLARGMNEVDNKQYEDVKEVFGTYGAAMIFRKSVFEITKFDPYLDIYHDEVDVCWKLRLNGLKFFYTPKDIVYHKIGGTISYSTKNMKYFMERNRFNILLQNYELKNLFIIIPRYLFLKFLELTLYIVYKKNNEVKSLIKAYIDSLINFKNIIKKRKIIQKSRKISDKKLMKSMIRHSVEIERFLKGYGKNILSQE